MKGTPAIVMKSEFDYADRGKPFDNYINYMNREDAKELKNLKTTGYNFFKYMDYMADETKHGSLFDQYDNELSQERMAEIKSQFKKAGDAGSPLWKDVLSFDNSWLEEHGLYNSKSHWLNEDVMKGIVRNAFQTMVESEKMRLPVWTASFHYNTNNIHVHIATVDMDPTNRPLVQAKNKRTKELEFNDDGSPKLQRRGKRKLGILDKVKSDVVNSIADRTPAYKRINELIRDNARRVRAIELYKDHKVKDLMFRAIKVMPYDLKQWKYNYSSVDEARPYIDKISEIFIEEEALGELFELENLLDDEVAHQMAVYGGEFDHHYYKENKLDEMKVRMGNAVISVMKKHGENTPYGSNIKPIRLKTFRDKKYTYDLKPMKNVSRGLNRAMFDLKNAMHKISKDYRTRKNIAEHERMLEEREYERS